MRESIGNPLVQHAVPVPPTATSLMELHMAGVNVTLQPFDIAEPAQPLPAELIEPTFLLSQ